MRFENALVALRQGYKVCRKTSYNRMNGIYYKMDKDTINSYSMMNNKQSHYVIFSLNHVLANDWTVYKGCENDKD